jgi:Xaa-Pro aminopeptidase
MDLGKQKIDQAIGLLREFDIDMWMVFVRETSMMADPVMPLVVGHDVTWQSFFLFTKTGDAVAIIGNFDEALFSKSDHFTKVMPYTQGVAADIRQLIARIDPKSVALNYSIDDTGSDGLTHGMYLTLCDYLKDTPYDSRFVSSEPICSRLRSRKLPCEVDLISKAARETDAIWQTLVREVLPGMTEIEIADAIDKHIDEGGRTPAFPTLVNAGDKSDPGHGEPTSAKLSRGDLLHVDFGLKVEGYCSDIQRLAYFAPKPGGAAPAELIDAFETVRDIITETGTHCKPGVKGFDVDGVARRILKERGFEEYQHALGHQVGRSVHDGGAILGPRWERYGRTPSIPLEAGNVLTLELEIMLPGIGCVGLEEDIVVTDHGARFLSPRQTELVVA